MSCIVCNKASKYKCPKCVCKYCSIQCYKAHQCKPTGALNKEPPKAKPEELQLDEGEIILRKNDFSLLHTTSITNRLHSKKLAQVIKAIDCSSQKISLLQSAQKADKHFLDFCNDILKELGFIDSDGQFNSSRNKK